MTNMADYVSPTQPPGPLITLSDLRQSLIDPAILPEVNLELARWTPRDDAHFRHPNLFARWRQIMAYDPETGEVWNRFVFQRVHSLPMERGNKPKLTERKRLGNRIWQDGRGFTAANVVWFLHNGEWPHGRKLGRVDGDAFNDRIENLVDLGSRHEGVRRYEDGWEAFAVVQGRHRH